MPFCQEFESGTVSDHCADAFLGKHLQQHRVWHAPIDDVGAANATFNRIKGALYLRPMLMGTAEDLGVKPSSESTFLIYCSPVGNYFKGELKAIRLQAVQGFSRAGTAPK